jgi:hypothetical protein
MLIWRQKMMKFVDLHPPFDFVFGISIILILLLDVFGSSLSLIIAVLHFLVQNKFIRLLEKHIYFNLMLGR